MLGGGLAIPYRLGLAKPETPSVRKVGVSHQRNERECTVHSQRWPTVAGMTRYNPPPHLSVTNLPREPSKSFGVNFAPPKPRKHSDNRERE